MGYALGNGILVLAGVGLFFFVDDPAAIFSFVGAEEARYVFLALLASIFSIAVLVNNQRFETPAKLFTSWATTAIAVVLVGIQSFGIVKDQAQAIPVHVEAEEPEEAPRRKQRTRNDDVDSVRTYGAVEIPASANGNFYTRATINDTRMHVLVDTGASFVALRFEDAEKMGLDPLNLDYDIKLGTANGVAMGAEVYLDEVTVAGITVNNVRAVVSQKGAMGITLLGMTYLSRIGSFKVSSNTLILGE